MKLKRKHNLDHYLSLAFAGAAAGAAWFAPDQETNLILWAILLAIWAKPT